MRITRFEARRARKALEKSLGEIRQCGQVEVLTDMVIMAVVRFTPLTPADGTFDSQDWGSVREPTTMLVDPLRYVKKLQADSQLREHGHKNLR